jgi:hypothetical protein
MFLIHPDIVQTEVIAGDALGYLLWFKGLPRSGAAGPVPAPVAVNPPGSKQRYSTRQNVGWVDPRQRVRPSL